MPWVLQYIFGGAHHLLGNLAWRYRPLDDHSKEMQLQCPLVAVMHRRLMFETPCTKKSPLVPLGQEALREIPLGSTLPRHSYYQDQKDVVPVFKKLII